MGVDGVDSSLYALSRFGVAAFALAPFALKGWKNANMDGETLRTSIVCGSWVAFGYLGQTRECSFVLFCFFLSFFLSSIDVAISSIDDGPSSCEDGLEHK